MKEDHLWTIKLPDKHIQITKHGYLTQNVMSAMVSCILLNQTNDSLFWATELFETGYEKTTFDLLRKIYDDFFAVLNPKYLRRFKKAKRRWTKETCLCMVLDLLNKAHSYEVFCLDLVYQLYETVDTTCFAYRTAFEMNKRNKTLFYKQWQKKEKHCWWWLEMDTDLVLTVPKTMKIVGLFDVQEQPIDHLPYQFGFSPYWIQYFIKHRLWTDYKTRKVFTQFNCEVIDPPVLLMEPEIERVMMPEFNEVLTADEITDVLEIPVIYYAS
jgi:hypothetical protein